MTKLCRDCAHCLWTPPNTTGTPVFDSHTGPWCGAAISRLRRTPDRIRGGWLPLDFDQVHASAAKRNRKVIPVFDVLTGTCGSRGRWFAPKEQSKPELPDLFDTTNFEIKD